LYHANQWSSIESRPATDTDALKGLSDLAKIPNAFGGLIMMACMGIGAVLLIAGAICIFACGGGGTKVQAQG
jgi:hypothetical protein